MEHSQGNSQENGQVTQEKQKELAKTKHKGKGLVSNK